VVKNISAGYNEGVVECRFMKGDKTDLSIHFNLFDNLYLAWVV
jgi:hypothetical protein